MQGDGCNDLKNLYKSAYQRAHYYKKPVKKQSSSSFKWNTKPEVFFYDPIIKRKVSTYQYSYDKNKSDSKRKYFYYRDNYASKSTLKYLLQEYHKKTPRSKGNYFTTSGTCYQNPWQTEENSLLEGLNAEVNSRKDVLQSQTNASNKILKKIQPSKFYSYMNTDASENDAITYHNNKTKNKLNIPKKIHDIPLRPLITVPFTGGTSTYQQDYGSSITKVPSSVRSKSA